MYAVINDTSFQSKGLKILCLLLVSRLSLYVPVPGVGMDLFLESNSSGWEVSILTNLIGSTVVSIGSLGILPYINASILTALVIPSLSSNSQTQNEESKPDREKTMIYIRYITFGWALLLSNVISVTCIKPILLEWSFNVACKIVLALTVGALLSMWFSELITKEAVGTGSSMILFINILGGLANSGIRIGLGECILFLIIVFIVILLQGAYKGVTLVSIQEKSSSTSYEEPCSIIPFKFNQGGITPLVFSTSLAVLIAYPLQSICSDIGFSNDLVNFIIISMNVVLTTIFSCASSILGLNTKELVEKLQKSSFTTESTIQEKTTVRFFEKIRYRLAITSGFFLSFVVGLSMLLNAILHLGLSTTLTTTAILVGVILEVSSQVKGYLLSERY
jgi:preprotein translocase subunit SecY